MSINYLKDAINTRKIPQSEPIPFSGQVPNNAGGYGWTLSVQKQLERFLILGSSGGSYYVSERKLTQDNAQAVLAALQADGITTVQRIAEISVNNLAPKNDPALFALALAATHGDLETRRAAFNALPVVARTGTHLFTFTEFVNSMRGWGMGLRKAYQRWFLDKPAEKLAYQLVKYQQRNGWSQRDLLRLTHPKARTPQQNANLHYAVHGNVGVDASEIIHAVDIAKKVDDEDTILTLIGTHGLTHEMIPTQFLKSPAVWEALLAKMPMTAMIRNLGRMSAAGLLGPFSTSGKLVIERLGDAEILRKARIHPIAVLTALLTYKNGRGTKGSLTWQVNPQIVAALDSAFYAAFKNVEPTGKNLVLGIDVSGSMTSGQVAGVPGLTPNMGAAAMALVTAKTEPNHFIGGFAERFRNLGISSRDSLEDALQKTQDYSFGGTDTSVMLNYALQHKIDNVDAFVIYTDGETWAGDIHTAQALSNYRRKTGSQAKLIVVGMVSNNVTVVDPRDPNSLDIVGFDSSVPEVLRSFLLM